MTLRISKLQELLASKGFIANKYFVMNEACFYIEVFAINTADVFLLYIPSKYTFIMEDGPNVYKMKYLEMKGKDDVEDEYAGTPDNMNTEMAYGNQVQLSPDNEKLQEHLEENYKHTIQLKDISKDDTDVLRSLHRQMRRLRYCVQNIKYKLGIFYKNYICAIRRDDSIDCMAIKHYPRTDYKKLMVIVDLETLYDKNDKLAEDVYTVRNSIYFVLQRNQSMHSTVIGKLIENKKDIAMIPQQASIKKAKYDSMIQKLEQMLAVMIESEKKVMEQLYELDNGSGKEGLQTDISKAHQKVQLEQEFSRISAIKADITKTMFYIRVKRENAMLEIDKIMFDNTVMFDCMIKNFGKLKAYC
jgi:hypothetical protein